MVDDLSLSTMSRDELEIAIDWAANEGWNPGLHDAENYFAADAHGFLIGRIGTEPVATISVVRYGSFGFLGFYIVHPRWRGRGHGWRIWQAGMQRLAGCTIGLDGVVAQQGNYRKSGFELAWRNIRFEGIRNRSPAPEPDPRIVPLASIPFETVAHWDRPFFHGARPDFLRVWISQPDSVALGIIEDGGMVGYGVARKCRSGWKIAPLYADRTDLATALFQALIGHVQPDEAFFLDVPETNHEAVALAERNGMRPSFETARMYTAPTSELPISRIYGITSFEIG